MSVYMDFTCPDALSPESNGGEALMLDDDDVLLNSENVGSNYLEYPKAAQLSAPNSRPWFSYWLTQSNRPAIIVGAGLENLGNTCFLNSVMQCFIHTVPLICGILSDKHSNCDEERFCVVCVMRELIDLSLTYKNGCVAPTSLVYNLGYFSSGFQRYQQEDAHEFLQCFLDRLESSYSSSQSDNIVKQVFGGRLVSKLMCCNCGHCSDTYEPSIDLSLEIEDADDLLTSLQSFTKVEYIEDPETMFTCEECKEQVSVEKQLSFDQTPSVAVFQLKRFKNDGRFVQKIDKHVAFPLELDLLPFTSGARESDMEHKYKLYAIVVHAGCTSTSGHYYCFIRSSPNVWCKFDDSRVELVSEGYVLSQEAYLLFYAKEGTTWFSSFIETQTYFNVNPTTCNTSPKSVLDRIGTSPGNSMFENKLSPDCNGIKDSGRITALPEKENCTAEVDVGTHCQNDTRVITPPRSPSPVIYREGPSDAAFSIPIGHLRKGEGNQCKRRLENDLDNFKTSQAYSYIKKTMPFSRGQQILAALQGSKTEPSSNKKARKSSKDGPSIRPLIR